MQLTKDQVYALNNIWEQIAPDLLDAIGAYELPRDEVIEVKIISSSGWV